MASITHSKTDTIPDWTQEQLDAQIAAGNYPAGTLLADIVLPSDWNAGHVIDLGIADITGLQTALDGKVDENSAITGATKTKITYDAKGLVTAGADATTADIDDSSNKRYVTDAQLTVIGNTSGTNTGDQNLSGYELLSNKATDFSTINNTLYPTVQAVNNAINTAVTGLLDYRGSYDASTNLFPATGGSGVLGAILKGDFWICSVAGTLGGESVTAGDLIIAIVDTPAQTAANWDLIEHNIGSYVSSVSGTTNRITSTGGSTPVIDISASYVGQNSITTVGTISTGTWNGTAIGDSYISSAATWNAKQSAITFGTGVQTALGVNIGSAGAPVLFNGSGGTPSSMTATNLTGTAAGLTAGNVTTNANLTGVVTSTGNATAIADAALSIAKTSGLQTALDGKQPLATVLTNTTASFTTAQETKLAGIETAADVTDTANVTSAGALMDSEVTSLVGVKAMVIPNAMTITDPATYSPTLTGTANISSVTNTISNYVRIGNWVQVWGRISATATAAASTATTFDMSLPVASNMTDNGELCGNFWMTTRDAHNGGVTGAATTDVATFSWLSQSTAARTLVYNYSYLIK